MDEEKKKLIAIFRFGVISDFIAQTHLEHGEKESLLKQKADRQWQIPFSQRSRLAPSTIDSWIRRYQQSGGRLEALYPRDRSDCGLNRAFDEETAQAIITVRTELPTWPVKMLITEIERRGLIPAETSLKPQTVYRFLQRHGLKDLDRPTPIDRRRFEAEGPNDIWQSDIMHGPSVLLDGKKRKTFLTAFLDDFSRLAPHAEFYLYERLDVYLDALRIALLKRGLPRKLYVDNGPAFRSRHLDEITASMGIALAHSQPYKPQGRGKIERFFRTIRTQFLPTFQGQSLEQLNSAFQDWLRTDYHSRPHSSTGMSPVKRFCEKMECIRPAPQNLEDYFRIRARRRVAKDRAVSLNGRLYEAPVHLIGKQITILYHDHDPDRVEVVCEGKSYGLLTPVDLNVNCRVKRVQHTLHIQSVSDDPIPCGRLPFRPKDKETPS
jgi:transposase InsO family protein